MHQIGSVPYLNALPLLQGLENVTSSPIFFDTPANLHEAVLAKKVAVALLPVVSYLENPELRLIPGTGIACKGEVKSVKVFHKKEGLDLSNCETIFLDTNSKTSQKLLKVLLVKKYHRDLKKISWAGNPDSADSVLIIGDNALRDSHFGNATDLGSDWFEITGLPFVFACWMSQIPITQQLLTHLHNAKMLGKQSIEEISLQQNIIEPDEAESYLKNNIKYDIEGPDLVGMKLFFDWVEELENQDYDTSLRFVA